MPLLLTRNRGLHTSTALSMHSVARPLPAPAALAAGKPRCRAHRVHFTCNAAAASKGFGGKAAANPVGVQKNDECPWCVPPAPNGTTPPLADHSLAGAPLSSAALRSPFPCAAAPTTAVRWSLRPRQSCVRAQKLTQGAPGWGDLDPAPKEAHTLLPLQVLASRRT